MKKYTRLQKKEAHALITSRMLGDIAHRLVGAVESQLSIEASGGTTMTVSAFVTRFVQENSYDIRMCPLTPVAKKLPAQQPNPEIKKVGTPRTQAMVGETIEEIETAIAKCNDVEDCRAIREVLQGDGLLNLAMKAAARIDKLRGY